MVYVVLELSEIDDVVSRPIAVFDDRDEAYSYAVGLFGPDRYRVCMVPFVLHVGFAG